MKVFVYLFLVILLMLDKIKSERRITNGKKLPGGHKRYMAYLLRAPASPRHYNAWVCGGAIVHRSFIVTSGACVEDIEYMYAIAAYEKYVPSSKMDEDECIKSFKKKVVFVCTPKTYELDYERTEKWANVDIAAVKVESPFNFNVHIPPLGCTWVPNMIEISFEAKHQAPETDVMVLGWGHSSVWRKPSDPKDYNQEILQYSPTLILDKNACKHAYKSAQPTLLAIIDKYMICTAGEGNLDADGRIINKTPGVLDGCGELKQNLCDPNDPNLKAANQMSWAGFNNYYIRRRTNSDYNETETELPLLTRRNGICQNDHGGPLVTWVGGREVLIGVASVFIVDAKDRTCVGPYLHTSTQCNGAFLNCVLKMFDEDSIEKTANKTRRTYESPEMVQERLSRENIIERYRYMVMMNGAMCDLPAQEKGFEMVQRRISWLHHPDGPAQNEIADDLIERPQIPLNSFS